MTTKLIAVISKKWLTVYMYNGDNFAVWYFIPPRMRRDEGHQVAMRVFTPMEYAHLTKYRDCTHVSIRRGNLGETFGFKANEVYSYEEDGSLRKLDVRTEMDYGEE